MKTRHKFYLALNIAIIILWAVWLSGCARHRCTETVPIVLDVGGEQIVAEYKSEVTQSMFLYWTSSRHIERITPFSTMYVGQLDSKPDPNSVGLAIDIVNWLK